MGLLAWTVYGTGDANVSYEAATISHMIAVVLKYIHVGESKVSFMLLQSYAWMKPCKVYLLTVCCITSLDV